MWINEIEPFACDWLANLFPDSIINRKSIKEIQPHDITHHRAHFFAGIGGWELALQEAGFPNDLSVWTGSCPCQPFSAAGKRKGTADERHLWPEFFRLINECRPAIIFGEQVASKDGLGWLDGISADLEGAGYAIGSADLCAASFGAPHIRQRLYWVAIANGTEFQRKPPTWEQSLHEQGGGTGGVGNANCIRQDSFRGVSEEHRAYATGGSDGLDHTTEPRHTRTRTRTTIDGNGTDSLPQRGNSQPESTRDGEAYRLGISDRQGSFQGRQTTASERHRDTTFAASIGTYRLGDTRSPRLPQRELQPGIPSREGRASPWETSLLANCRDGKARRVSSQSGDEPLAYGVPVKVGPILARLGELGFSPEDSKRIIREARRNRVGRLKGYGNAIVPQCAVEFIKATMELLHHVAQTGQEAAQ